MTLVRILVLACVFALVGGADSASAGTVPAGFTDSVAISGLASPTAVRFSADGRIFVAEKSGLIKVFDSVSDPTATVFADLRTNVHNYWDRGLLGLALDPAFPSKPYVYVLYTYDHILGSPSPPPRWGTPGGTSDTCPSPPGPTTNGCVVSGRVSRLEASGDLMTGAENVLIEDWCQQFPGHSIGSLAFGADGALYVTGGEGANFDFVDYGQMGSPLNPCGDPPGGAGATLTPPTAEGGSLRSQDLRTSGDPVGLSGALVRVNPDTGAALPDNPSASSTDPNARRIVAYGLRNPFRIAVRPGTSDVWIGDVGWSSWEEINRVSNPTGGVLNFGWPCYEGPGRVPGFDSPNLAICENLYAQPVATTAPLFNYPQSAKVVPGETCPSGGSSISGLAFSPSANGPYPPEYDGALFFSDYSRNCIWAMQKGGTSLPNPSAIKTFVAAASNPVDLQVSPDGELYYVDLDGGTVHRVQFAGTGNRAPTARASATPTSGAVPLTVTFDGTASSDPDPGDTLTYAWDLDGNGTYTDSSDPRPTHVFTTAGSHSVGLRVTDSRGATGTGSVTVTAGRPPAATIGAPSASTTWKVGDTIAFSGSGSDPDEGSLPQSALSWELILRHCPSTCHSHSIQTFAGVASGSFSAPDHDYPAHLELRLTVTDSSGLTGTASVALDPKTVTLRFDSAPAGLQLAVGGSASVTPFTRIVIEGSSNSVSASSPQALGGTSYSFVSWSDGGAASHNIVADPARAALTATYGTAQTLTLAAEADAPVKEANAGSNFATANLRTDGGTGARVESYLRFTVPTGVGTIETAKLRVYASSATADGPAAYAAGSGWTEAGLTWTNRPARTGSGTDDKARIATNTWVEYNVKPLVSGPGTYSLVLAGPSSDGVDFYSREAASANKPQLVLSTGGGSPPPTDTGPPTVAQNLAATTAGSTQINLAWTASTDDIGVTGYEVYRGLVGGTLTMIATTVGTGTTYADSGLAPSTAYAYQVRARDASGKVSGPSNTATATTSGGTSPPPSAISLVKQTTGSVSGGTSLAVPVASVAGNALVANIAVKAGGSVSVASVRDSTGATWTKGAAGFLSGSNTRVETWYRLGAPAVTSVTATLSAANTAAANVTEWRGVAAPGPLDGALGAGNAASTTAAAPSVTTTQPGDLVIGAVNYAGNVASTLASGGFTALSSFSVTTVVNGRAAYAVATTTGSYRASWTLASSVASGGTTIALRAAAPP
jgi:glucose/arabinose dehydrogenase